MTTDREKEPVRIGEGLIEALAAIGGPSASDRGALRRLFETLFSDAFLTVELHRALGEWASMPGEEELGGAPSERAQVVNEVLRRANGGADPRLDDLQIRGLHELWGSEGSAPTRPSTTSSALIGGLRFWRELMAFEPDQGMSFHAAITRWGQRRDEESWRELLRHVEGLGLEEPFAEEHAEALVYLTREGSMPESVWWFGGDGDLW